MRADARRSENDREWEFADRMRFSMLAHDPDRYLSELFPELQRMRQAVQDDHLARARANPVPVEPDEDLDEATGSWDFSQVQMGEDQVSDFLASIMGPDGMPRATLKASDLSRNGNGNGAWQ